MKLSTALILIVFALLMAILLLMAVPKPADAAVISNPYGHEIKCIPKKLWGIVNKVAGNRRVTIYSGYRSHAHNRRVGGAHRSEHLHCKALDIIVAGMAPSIVIARANAAGAGGTGQYCGRPFVHIDVGSKRKWHWHCGGHNRGYKHRHGRHRKRM